MKFLIYNLPEHEKKHEWLGIGFNDKDESRFFKQYEVFYLIEDVSSPYSISVRDTKGVCYYGLPHSHFSETTLIDYLDHLIND